MEEGEGSITIASMEEGVRPPDEAQQWLAMVFVNLLGEVVKVVNGGDHLERERKREKERERVDRREEHQHNNHSQLTDLNDKPR